MNLGDLRSGLLAAILATGWKLAKDAMLEVGNPITFLGIDIIKLPNGDLKLYQERFTDSLLSKHGMENSTSIRSVQMGSIPTEPDVPSLTVLRQLQGYSGEFNWLATRTRPDISYYTSMLASACSKFATWSLELAKNILRFSRELSQKELSLQDQEMKGSLMSGQMLATQVPIRIRRVDW